MATTTRKRSRATLVNHSVVGQAINFLQDLPEKQKEELSLREAVGQMQDSLQTALSKGYSYEDLSALLGNQGIKISALTLKNYLPSDKRQLTKSKPRRSRKSAGEELAEQPTAPEPIADTPAPVEAEAPAAAEPAKPKRGRPKSTAKATAAPDEEKADAAPASTARRRTKTTAAKTTKPTSTRGRKRAST